MRTEPAHGCWSAAYFACIVIVGEPKCTCSFQKDITGCDWNMIGVQAARAIGAWTHQIAAKLAGMLFSGSRPSRIELSWMGSAACERCLQQLVDLSRRGIEEIMSCAFAHQCGTLASEHCREAIVTHVHGCEFASVGCNLCQTETADACASGSECQIGGFVRTPDGHTQTKTDFDSKKSRLLPTYNATSHTLRH